VGGGPVKPSALNFSHSFFIASHRDPANDYQTVGEKDQRNVRRAGVADSQIKAATLMDGGLGSILIGLVLLALSDGGILSLLGGGLFALGLSLLVFWPAWEGLFK
jgi:hypothetical protein